MRINPRFCIGLLATNLICTGATYWQLEKVYHRNIKERLEQATKSIPYILGKDYFDRIVNVNSISSTEYTKIRKRLEKYVKDVKEISTIYAYTIEGNRVVRVADTFTKLETYGETSFFLEYQSADQKVKNMLNNPKLTASLTRYEDEYGEFIAYLAPYTNSKGRQFLLGADFPVAQEKIQLWQLLGISFLISSLTTGIYGLILRYRHQFASARIFCQGVVLLLSFSGIFWQTDRLVINKLKTQLYIAARSLPEILGEKFIAKSQNRYSISEKEHKKNVSILHEYALNIGVKYVYTLRKEGDMVVFTADSAVEPGFTASYWEVYDTIPKTILTLFTAPGRIYAKYTDDYGNLVSVIFSYADRYGKLVVFGADRAEEDINKARLSELFHTFFIISIYLIVLLIWENLVYKQEKEYIQKVELHQQLFWKMTGITSSAIVIFLTGFYFYAQSILYKSYGAIEIANVKEQMEELKKAIAVEERFFGNRFYEWLGWNRSEQIWQKSGQGLKISSDMLRKLDVNLIAYLDKDKLYLRAKTYDRSNQEAMPELSTKILSYLQKNPGLINISTNNKRLQTGIIYFDEQLHFLALAPIAEKDLTVRGTVIATKKIDDDFIVSLAQRQKLNVRFYSIPYAQKVKRFQSVLDGMLSSQQNAIVPENNSYIYGYTFLKDVYNKPVAFIRLVSEREVWLKANELINRTFLFGLAGCGLIILATNSLFVLRRLLRLVRNIEAIQENKDRTQNLPIGGNDEISYLMQIFNQLINNLEMEKQTIKSINKKLEIANEKFSKAFLASPNAIAIVTLDEEKFFEVNPTFVEMVGYSEEEILGRTVGEVDNWMAKEDRPVLFNTLQKEGFLRNYQVRFFNKWGEMRVGSLFAEIIVVNETRCVLYNIADITELKVVEEKLTNERDKADRLLENVLPKSIAHKLKQNITLFSTSTYDAYIAEQYEDVAILFADLVGFSQLSRRSTPKDIVGLLNRIFSIFDQLSENYKLEKIKTIGDAYMVVGGLPLPIDNSLQAIAAMALDMQREIAQFRTYEGEQLSLRIGIDIGSVVAGTIGKKKFSYDLWGEPVNIASRMESQGEPGKIQVTEKVYKTLYKTHFFAERGIIFVKGIGEMRTYWLLDNPTEWIATMN